jgi:hypothetical protein
MLLVGLGDDEVRDDLPSGIADKSVTLIERL